ncbi:MAG: hypothetical protein HY908_11790 [Myxococcales bacterium]|nr:hypothetical protein [Myxococcales bacterium]
MSPLRRRAPFARALALFLSGAAVAGCEAAPVPPAEPGAPELRVPEAPTAAVPSAAWSAELPAASVELAPGTRVWAAVPTLGSELVSVGIYTLESIDAERANLVDKLGTRTLGVAPALVHPIGTAGGLEPGDTALFFTWTTPAALGRVTRKVGGSLRVRYDWAGETKDTTADHAEPARKGVVPFAYVTFPKFGRQSLGLVVALDPGHVWVRTSSGHVERHPREAVGAVEVATAVLKVGAKVRAYDWVDGLREAVVSEVVEPGLRYAVRAEGSERDERYFFTALVPRVAAR